MTTTQDSEERVAEAARLWTEVDEFVRKLCPDAEPAEFPTWFPHLISTLYKSWTEYESRVS